MACVSQFLEGIAADCSTSMGGIKTVMIGAYPESGAPFTIEDGVVTAINTGVTFHSFNFRKNTGSMTSTLNVDDANGVNYVSTELVLQFNRMETAKRIAIAGLVMSDVVVVVEDSNGSRYALGVDDKVSVTAGTGQTGTAKSDGNFYQITLTDESSEFPPLLKSDIVITPID